MKKILIIDDEQVVVDTLTLALEGMRFEVISTTDPVEGMHLFAEHEPFLILLDINMGTMNGLDFIDHLIQNELPKHRLTSTISPGDVMRDGNSQTLKQADFFVVVLTGYGDKQLMHNCRALGVEYFLNKPIHLLTLRNTLDKLYQLKLSRDSLKEVL
jgi:CheY-like chemotaxis protein